MKLYQPALAVLLFSCSFVAAQTTTVLSETLVTPESQPTITVSQSVAPLPRDTASVPAVVKDTTATPGAITSYSLPPSSPDSSATNTASLSAITETVLGPPPLEQGGSGKVSKNTLSATQQARCMKMANQLYGLKAYSEAIPYYEKARQGDSVNKTLLANLGDCYRLTNNTMGKLHCYRALVTAGLAEPIHELYYGQTLVEIGELEKARIFFENYKIDNRGSNLASSFLKMKMYTRNADAYSVYAASFNSLQNDICAVKFHDAVVFTSSRRKTSWIRREQGWTNEPYMQLYVTGRDDKGVELKPQIFMSDLNSKFNDGPVSFTKDFNTVYFTRNNFGKDELAKDGTYKLKLLEANLDQNGFNMVKLMSFNNKEYNFAHPSISPDGYTLYFSSDLEGGKGGMDIYMSKKDSSGTWGTPVNLGDKVNTAGNEVFPFIASNGSLYFSSDGQDGLGGLDIYEVRMKNGMPSKIYNMGEPVNSRNDDFGIYLMDDNKSGFISSNRKSGGLDDDIYNLQILREVKRGKEVNLAVKDMDTKDSLAGARIVINGDTVVTDQRGIYTLSAEEEQMYKLEVTKPDYYNSRDSVSAVTSEEESFTKELLLEKDPKVFLRGIITDAKTGEPLEGATIKLTDLTSNTNADVYTTTASGDYFKFMTGTHLGDKLAYLVRIEKPGYLERTMVFTHSIEKPGEINLNENLSLALGKVAVGMDLAKMIDIKPIYFDYGKSDIRKDAASELDKVVQVMNEYPNMFIELGSHTDCRSSAASNLKLSGNRAKASVAYIVKKGINKTRIVAKGYGESKLLNNCSCEGKKNSNCSEEDHAMNRRTEFIITKLK